MYHRTEGFLTGLNYPSAEQLRSVIQRMSPITTGDDMNKITRDQYDTAKRNVVRLGKAQETVDAWENAIKAFGPSVDGVEVTEIDTDDMTFKGRPKEVPRVKDAAA
jgi:hypothetical protein